MLQLDNLDLTTVISDCGIKINRCGFARCPFHAEKTASLKIYDRRWKCFGCGEHGDALDFVCKYYEVDIKEGIKILNERYRLNLKTGRPNADYIKRRKQQQREIEITEQLIRTAAKELRRLALPPVTADKWRKIEYLEYVFDTLGGFTRKANRWDYILGGVKLQPKLREDIYGLFEG